MSGSGDGQQQAPTAFDRFFPGPARRDPDLAKRLEAIQRVAQDRAAQRQQRQDQRRGGGPRTEETPNAVAEALQEQTEVLRALLDAEIAVRDDARSTAQNSRTFAVAGTVIAFFTMVAAVVTVVVAFLPHG